MCDGCTWNPYFCVLAEPQLAQHTDNPCETNIVIYNGIARTVLRESWCLQREDLAD